MEGIEYVNNIWSNPHFGRITKGASLALKTRVLLYAASPLNTVEGTYNASLCIKAAQAAAQIINMGIYSTNIDYRNLQFNQTPSNPENILDARSCIGGLFNYMELWNYPKGGDDLYIVPSVGCNATCPSQGLVDAYETIDGSPVSEINPYINRDPRLKETILCNGDQFNDAIVESFVGGNAAIGGKNQTTTGYYLKKFVQEKVKLPSGEVSPHIWYIFRYGEVLLNYAEAMFYAFGPKATQGYITNGRDLSALDAINLIRSRPGVNMPKLTSLTEDQLQNEVALNWHSRSPFWDVRRWKIAEMTENAPLMGIRIIKNYDTNNFIYNKVKIENRKFNKAIYHYPIPIVR